MELTQQEIDNRIEFVLDRVAESLISNENITPEIVNQSQRTIRNGLISLGRGNADRLVLNQKDIEANPQDLESEYDGLTLRGIVTDIPNINQITIDTSSWPFIYLSYVVGEGEPTTHEISALLQTIPLNQEGPYSNPVNVGQFINLLRKKTEVDIEQAKEYLDTNIFELLPTVSTRQQRIDDLFIELNNLLPSAPSDVQWGLQGDGRVDRDEDGNWVGSYQYYLDNSISAPQDNPNYEGPIIDEEDGLITRISNNASGLNQSKTIEDLRDRLNDYLKDVDEEPADVQDERPVYRNKSNGYIKFRNLNQGIIIRNTKQKYIEGLNPDSQEYLNTGFSITMWVRFLDKTSSGTLFNFGNPTRGYMDNTALGFRLETYILNKDDECPHNNHETWGDGATAIDKNYFEKSNTARFVRLVVNDFGQLRDSHVGDVVTKIGPPSEFMESNIPYLNYPEQGAASVQFRLLQTTFIPEDFNEWYFICASFNPDVDEDNSDFDNTNPDYWLNHIDGTGTYTNFSALGNKCKVEIISRTDLLRARGYKV